MNYLKCFIVVVSLFASTNVFAQYAGQLFGPINVDDGTAVSGLAATSVAPTTNGSIRYQWRVLPSSTGDNRWLGFEWDSRTRVFAFYGNPTFTASDNVTISDQMDIGGSAYSWGNPGNFRINGSESTKRLILNIVDTGTTLSTAPGNNQIQFGLTEINHANALASVNDNTTNGMYVTRSGNTLTLGMTNTAENSGSNEEIWWQWSHDNWTTKNFIEDTAIAANETTTINLSSSAPILREGDTLRFNVGTFGPVVEATISATYSNSLGFDIAAINKSRVVIHSVTDDDTTGPSFSSFSVAGKTDAEILAGGWTLTGNIQDTGSGVNENGAAVTTDNFSPNYDLLNAASAEVVNNQLFATRPSDGGAQGSPATLADTVPAVAAASIDLGTYTVRASATDNDEDPSTSANDRTAVIDSQIGTFTVTDDDTTAPVLSGFSIANKTDGQIVAGGWTISGDITDAGSGVNNNGATVTTDDFSPNFDIMNNANTELAGNQLFTTRPADGANGTVSAAAPAIAAGTSIDLGTYKVTVSATDNDEDRTAVNDRQAIINSQVATFTVTDDDTTGPDVTAVTGNSEDLEGYNYLNTDLASGLALSMEVMDNESGVDASAPKYGLARDGAAITSGSLTPNFANGGAMGSPGNLTATIAAGHVQTVGSYILYVTNSNYDVDRGNGDKETSVDTYSFTVYANTPVITVQAGTLAFGNQTVNTSGSEQSYTVSGINLGSDPIVITAPSGFQVSTTSGSGFGSSVNLTPSGGTVNNTTIYARFTPNNVAGFSANITHTHTSAPQQDKAVTGTGTAPGNPAAFSAAAASSSSITLTFSLNAQSKPVVIVRDTDNTFSAPSGAPPGVGNAFAGGTVVYNGSASPQTDTGLGGGTLYYYRAFSYDNVNGHFYSSGSSASATTIPSAPVVAADSVRTWGGFNANWNASSGATGYRIDVAHDTGFTSLIANNVDVGNQLFYTVSGQMVGHYFYRVRAYNGSGTSGNSGTQSGYTLTAQGVNGGGTPPAATVVIPGTLYVGDNGTFAVKTWGTANGNWSKWRVVIDTDNNLIAGGIRGDFTADFSNSEYKSQTSPRFTSAGLWYWGMQIDYGGTLGTNFWMVTTNADWADLYYRGTNANLAVTVLALENPSGVSAMTDGTYPAERIDLAWTRWNTREVMVVRSLDNVFTAPTPGATYLAGNTIGGDTVIYRGPATTFEDTGLTANTTYYYRFYSENHSYYSAGADASETTDAAPEPDAPVATAASSVGRTSFTANWNASAGATSYRIDVSRNASFTDLVVSDHNPGNVTSYAVSGFGTGHYYYRVRAVNGGGTSDNSNVIEIGTQTAQARNTGGAGSPQLSPATIYLGDTATFGLDSDATLPADNYGRARVWVHTTTSLLSGTPSSWSTFVNTVNRTVTRQMTSVGTFYYGIQLDYGFPPYSNNFWYVRSSASYYNMHYNPTGVTLQVTVTALGEPSDLVSTVVGQNQINLSWTKWNGRDVMIVRSLDNSFGTPTPGQTYTAGNTIAGDTVVYKGSGTSFNDTGLTQSTPYYYKFFSENFGYYSSGVVDSDTTEGTVPVAPVATAASSVQPTSFSANWNASVSATSYRLDVSTANNFSSFVGSYNNLNVGNVTTYGVSGLTGGQTYYYRVRAVNGAGDSLNSGTITVVTPASATVNITDIPLMIAPSTAEINWSATVGASYDVYYSDNDGASWSFFQQVEAAASLETLAITETTQRQFKVVIAGANATSSTSPAWGVVKPTIPAGYSLMAPPLDLTDLSLNGEFGTFLKQGLTGDNGGNADRIMIRDAGGSWTTIYLDGNNAWSQNYTFNEGQGFYIYRSGAAVQQRYDGPVGNNGVGNRAISTGWNIIGPSQGKSRTFSQITSALTGAPLSGWAEEGADLIIIDEGNGNFRRIMKYNGAQTWLDLKTFGTPNVTIHPGKAIYYLKRSGSGVSAINF